MYYFSHHYFLLILNLVLISVFFGYIFGLGLKHFDSKDAQKIIDFFEPDEFIYENRMKFFHKNRTILENFEFENLKSCDSNLPPKFNVTKLRDVYKLCAKVFQNRFFDDPFSKLLNWPTVSYVCDEEKYLKDLPVFPIGRENVYFGMVPNCKTSSNLYVSSIPAAIEAYENLRAKIPNSKFAQINLAHKSIEDFPEIFEDLKKSQNVEDEGEMIIDILWLNGNFKYRTIFEENGILAKLKITVCQLNLEIQMENARKFNDFTNLIFHHNISFLPMRPFLKEHEKEERITVIYFFNVLSDLCVRKYLKIMFKLVLLLVLLLALFEMVQSDASCWLGDTICKSITCRSCKLAECINGNCMCTLC